MSEQTDRDRVAKWLTDECMVDHSWRCAHPDTYGPCDCADRDAAELLASDWLAERDARVGDAALAKAVEAIEAGIMHDPHYVPWRDGTEHAARIVDGLREGDR